MKHLLFTLTLTCLTLHFAQAQAQSEAEREAAHMRVLTERSARIVETLGVDDTAKFARVRTIIALQYRDVGRLLDERNDTARAIRNSDCPNKDARVQQLEEKTTATLYTLHFAYIGRLTSELTLEQVDKVKDGMTFGRLWVAYNAYLEMIPTLTEEQKRHIFALLVEAREHAMNAESSRRRHWWFDQYVGRINNYLAAAGYDLRAEREESNRRQAAARENNPSPRRARENRP